MKHQEILLKENSNIISRADLLYTMRDLYLISRTSNVIDDSIYISVLKVINTYISNTNPSATSIFKINSTNLSDTQNKLKDLFLESQSKDISINLPRFYMYIYEFIYNDCDLTSHLNDTEVNVLESILSFTLKN